MSKINREQFEAWGMSDTDLRITLECETYAGIAWLAWQAATNEAEAKLTALTSQLESVVAENVALKAAFDKPQAYLSWHAIPPTWEDPLPCGEYLDVHDEAGHKNSDGTDCWPVFAKPEIETPATSAFLAEVRASGVEMFADNLLCPDLDDAIRDFAAQLRQGNHEIKVEGK